MPTKSERKESVKPSAMKDSVDLGRGDKSTDDEAMSSDVSHEAQFHNQKFVEQEADQLENLKKD